MKRFFIFLSLISIFALFGCDNVVLQTPTSSPTSSNWVVSKIEQKVSTNIYPIVINNGGIAKYYDVGISNFHSGKPVEIVYRITNNSSIDMLPEVFAIPYADVADLSTEDGKGTMNAPAYVYDEWLIMPVISESLKPGQTQDYTFTLLMPDGAKSPANRLAFKLGTAGISKATLRPTAEIWWIIQMR